MNTMPPPSIAAMSRAELDRRNRNEAMRTLGVAALFLFAVTYLGRAFVAWTD